MLRFFLALALAAATSTPADAIARIDPPEKGFFSKLCMWYFGTHGDLHIVGPKPGNGPLGLKAYDPKVFALFDDLFSGPMKVSLP